MGGRLDGNSGGECGGAMMVIVGMPQIEKVQVATLACSIARSIACLRACLNNIIFTW